jgi:hypothetical protein
MNGAPTLPDPFAVELRHATAPYGRGIGVLPLELTPAVSGTSNVLPYDFSAFEMQYALQPQNIVASYVLTLGADQLSSAATVEIAYIGRAGAGTVQLLCGDPCRSELRADAAAERPGPRSSKPHGAPRPGHGRALWPGQMGFDRPAPQRVASALGVDGGNASSGGDRTRRVTSPQRGRLVSIGSATASGFRAFFRRPTVSTTTRRRSLSRSRVSGACDTNKINNRGEVGGRP